MFRVSDLGFRVEGFKCLGCKVEGPGSRVQGRKKGKIVLKLIISCRCRVKPEDTDEFVMDDHVVLLVRRCWRSRVEGRGFRVQGSGSRVQGCGSRVEG